MYALLVGKVWEMECNLFVGDAGVMLGGSIWTSWQPVDAASALGKIWLMLLEIWLHERTNIFVMLY